MSFFSANSWCPSHSLDWDFRILLNFYWDISWLFPSSFIARRSSLEAKMSERTLIVGLFLVARSHKSSELWHSPRFNLPKIKTSSSPPWPVKSHFNLNFQDQKKANPITRMPAMVQRIVFAFGCDDFSNIYGNFHSLTHPPPGKLFPALGWPVNSKYLYLFNLIQVYFAN